MLKVENFRGTVAVDQTFHLAPNGPDWGYDVVSPVELQKGPYIPRFKQASLARIHQYFTKVTNALPEDPYDMLSIRKAFDSALPIAEMDDWSSKVLRWGMSPPIFEGQMMELEIPRRNTLMQAVALLKSKSDPAAGLPLTDHHRLDIDGKPIRIKKQPKGWIVYSIGFNRIDDGGTESNSKSLDFIVHLSLASMPPK